MGFRCFVHLSGGIHFKVRIENKVDSTLTPPGGYLYPFHIVPAMRSIHKTTIIAGSGSAGGACRGKWVVLKGVFCSLSAGNWAVFIQSLMVDDPA